jgi:endo-1,4-beta-xylanase
MRMRWFTVVGAVAAVAVGIVGVVSTSVADGPSPKSSEQTLRALGARHGLYVGTAVDMQALNDASNPTYRSSRRSSRRSPPRTS